MANPTWPSAPNFPQSPLIDGNQIQLGNNKVSFKPDSGRMMDRRRNTVRDDDVTYNFRCTRTQWTYFLNWYQATLGDGVLPFDYLDPTIAATKTFKFKSEPSAQYVGGLIVLVSCSLTRYGT